MPKIVRKYKKTYCAVLHNNTSAFLLLVSGFIMTRCAIHTSSTSEMKQDAISVNVLQKKEHPPPPLHLIWVLDEFEVAIVRLLDEFEGAVVRLLGYSEELLMKIIAQVLTLHTGHVPPQFPSATDLQWQHVTLEP